MVTICRAKDKRTIFAKASDYGELYEPNKQKDKN